MVDNHDLQPHPAESPAEIVLRQALKAGGAAIEDGLRDFTPPDADSPGGGLTPAGLRAESGQEIVELSATDMDRKLTNLAESLSPLAAKLMLYMLQHPGCNKREIRDHTGATKLIELYYFNKLKNEIVQALIAAGFSPEWVQAGTTCDMTYTLAIMPGTDPNITTRPTVTKAGYAAEPLPDIMDLYRPEYSDDEPDGYPEDGLSDELMADLAALAGEEDIQDDATVTGVLSARDAALMNYFLEHPHSSFEEAKANVPEAEGMDSRAFVTSQRNILANLKSQGHNPKWATKITNEGTTFCLLEEKNSFASGVTRPNVARKAHAVVDHKPHVADLHPVYKPMEPVKSFEMSGLADKDILRHIGKDPQNPTSTVNLEYALYGKRLPQQQAEKLSKQIRQYASDGLISPIVDGWFYLLPAGNALLNAEAKT